MTDDWLDDLLDRLPGEPVPMGFAQRVRARIEAKRETPFAPPRWTPFRGWLPQLAAASVLLAFGFWLGRGGPEISPPPTQVTDPVTASGEVLVIDDPQLLELYENHDLLEAWELVVAEDAELGLRDASTGTWELEMTREDG